MSNIVREIIEDAAIRVGNPRMDYPLSPGVFIRALNRVYATLNMKYNPLESIYEIDFGSLGSTGNLTEGYFTLPSDWIRPFKITPIVTNVPYTAYDTSETGVFTIYNNRIYFSGVTVSSTFDINYYSSGLELVDATDGDVAAGEANTPEYPAHLNQLLMYALCVELSSDYPKYKQDVFKVEELSIELEKLKAHKQVVTPEITGPREYNSIDLDYGIYL